VTAVDAAAPRPGHPAVDRNHLAHPPAAGSALGTVAGPRRWAVRSRLEVADVLAARGADRRWAEPGSSSTRRRPWPLLADDRPAGGWRQAWPGPIWPPEPMPGEASGILRRRGWPASSIPPPARPASVALT